MDEIQVNMSEFRQQVGDLINRAAYGGERIILVSHGQPRAAIIGMRDYQALKELDPAENLYKERFAQALQKADQVRERVARWQMENEVQAENSVETLQRLRQERDDGLVDLH